MVRTANMRHDKNRRARLQPAFRTGAYHWRAKETVKASNNIPKNTASVGWGELANPNNQQFT